MGHATDAAGRDGFGSDYYRYWITVMKIPVYLILALSLLGGSYRTSAADRIRIGHNHSAEACGSTRLLTGCPDDYCRKPTPRFGCRPYGQVDDYCVKSLPRVWRLPCGGQDDYCPKPWPDICRPIRPEHYNCGQPAHEK
jgi:hypothetical protein